MESDSPDVPRRFALKQIENDINTGFALVAAARNAFKYLRPAEGDGSLVKALGSHRAASERALESESVQVRGIIHQLKELREAIDWLLESHFPPHTSTEK